MTAIHHTPPRLAQNARAVVSGLKRTGAHHLPSWLLQDHVGATRYGALTRAPEHYQERTWGSLLTTYAEAIASLALEPRLIELDADGRGLTDAIAESLLAQHGWLHYIACAASDSQLDAALGRLRGKSPRIELEGRKVNPLHAGRTLADTPAPRLLLQCAARFSDLDPHDAASALRDLRTVSRSPDILVLAFDLAPDRERACAAYRDKEGHGGSLGLHALERVNQELGADFELGCWKPEVRWNDALGRVELVVVALDRQRVFFDELGLPLQFEAGETIQTASFQKHDQASIDRLLLAGGYRRVDRFVDDERCCTLVLATPI